MDAFVVIPCLDEQDGLAAACQSLGFPQGSLPHTTLVLVDNGSKDKTLDVMAEIQRMAQPGRVIIVEEAQQGYVPARHAGAIASREAAMDLELDLNEVVLLQADADTIYLPEYVRCMCLKASTAPSMTIIEGAAITAREFAQRYPEYDVLSRKIDGAMSHLLVDDADDVVLDDKVCAFRLEDYFAWGGHQREFDDAGDELFAETTRLYLRAKTSHHAKRVRVDEAAALPSRRKLIGHAPAYFASAGFPRQSRWFADWRSRCAQSDADLFLVDPFASGYLKNAVKSRQRHELALFGLLPLIVNEKASCDEATRSFFSSLNLDPCPGSAAALQLALHLADEQDGPLDAFICGRTQWCD